MRACVRVCVCVCVCVCVRVCDCVCVYVEEMAAQLELLKIQIAQTDGEIELIRQQQHSDGEEEPSPVELSRSSAGSSRGLDEARGARFIATKKLAVRSGIEASTRKVGSIAPGELVIGARVS